jgi:hypothetical protein
MIPGRTNVGMCRRAGCCVLDLKTSGKLGRRIRLAGVERKGKPADPDVARVLDWGMPDVSDDGARCCGGAIPGQQGSLVREADPATARLRCSHCTMTRGSVNWRLPAGPATGGGIAWLPATAFLFLSKKTGWMQLYSWT